MSITENELRIGAFTSSNIYKLMGSPAVQKTYIEERNIERRLGRSIDVAAHSNAMAWGTFLEQRVLDLLGLEYTLSSNETDAHPTISCWAGSKDLIVIRKKISDIKCYQPKNFAQYADALLTCDTEILKRDFPKEYWQLISNAIINQVPNAEAICYCPFKSELADIRLMAADYAGPDQWKYRFIYESPDSSLAWIPDGGYYNNLNKFEFTCPSSDKDLLTAKVMAASKLLVSVPELITA